MQPLSHHEIMGLVAPFTHFGRSVDLAASDRLQRRLAFKPVEHAAGGAAAGLPAHREQLQLELTDRARLDVKGTALIGQRFRECHDSMFGSTIGSRTSPGLYSCDTRHVNDQPTTLLFHLGESGPAAEECPAEIHVHNRVECFGRRLCELPAAEDTCVVHENIHPFILCHRLLEEPLDLPLIRHICLNRPSYPTLLLNLLHSLHTERHPSGSHHYGSSFLGKT